MQALNNGLPMSGTDFLLKKILPQFGVTSIGFLLARAHPDWRRRLSRDARTDARMRAKPLST
jgi:hypothetical protein